MQISNFIKIIIVFFIVFFIFIFFYSQKNEWLINQNKESIEEIKYPQSSSTTTNQIQNDQKNIESETISLEKTTNTKNSVRTEKTIETQQIKNIIPEEKSKYADFEELNTEVRKSVVNILCTTETSGILSPITGSGIVISSNGVILTNAHIGQYLLLKDFNGYKDFVECFIRTGNPAYPSYKVELLYISPTWIEKNKTILTEQNPKGTGEHDYAFLRITEKMDGTKIENIPFLPLSLGQNDVTNDSVLLSSYPAGFLSGQIIAKELYQSSSIAKISKIYTFGTNTIDLISVGGTILSQKGSSGGSVVNIFGELIGLISTSSDGNQTSDRDLRAITLSYINNDLEKESGSNLINILSSPAEYAKNFNENISPKLTEILTNAILKK